MWSVGSLCPHPLSEKDLPQLSAPGLILLQKASAPKNMPFLGSLHPVMEGAGPGQEPFQLNMGRACPRPPCGWSNASQIFLTVLMSFCPILLQPLTFHRCLSQKKKKKDSLHTQIHLCICFQRSQPTTVPPGAGPESTSVTRDLGATSRVTDRR